MALLVLFSIISVLVGNTVAQNAPPAIVISPPKFTTATPGQTLRMTCVAYGAPLPTITWSKLSEDLAAKLADSTSGYKKFDQTTTVGGIQFRVSVLEICGVTDAETDEYFCTADNSISGNGIASPKSGFFVSILTDDALEPAAIVARPPASGDAVDYGSTVEAVCVAYGNPVPAITWTKQGCVDIGCVNNAQIFNQVVAYGSGDVKYRKSTLQLCNLDQSNSGTYMCSADNGVAGDGVASNTFSWQLSVNPKPVVSTSDVVIPTTTCPGPPSTAIPMATTTSARPQASVEQVSADDAAIPESGYIGIMVIEILVVLGLLVAVGALVFIVFRVRSSQSSPNIGAAASTGYAQMEDDGPSGGSNMSYSNLVKKMEHN